MIEAIMLWNEPNNLSHWDFHLDKDWHIFSEMVIRAARAVRQINPALKIVLGGISPVDPTFIRLLASYGVLDELDIVAIHGFPLDWNHWKIDDWPRKVEEIRSVTDRPVWVSEAGASSFGAEEVQVFGLRRTAELLLPMVERVHWYSLFDLPASWTATTRHKEAGEAHITGTTIWASCARTARPNRPANIFTTGWASASGSITKIRAWIQPSSG